MGDWYLGTYDGVVPLDKVDLHGDLRISATSTYFPIVASLGGALLLNAAAVEVINKMEHSWKYLVRGDMASFADVIRQLTTYVVINEAQRTITDQYAQRVLLETP